ncbi:MAG: protein kinase, partial [Acidobacteriota bacterium]
MIGRTIDHYRIVEELGEGSMGVVYRAVDTRLERRVALKFLPPGSIREEVAKQRFLREARAASRLDHPNICTIHEIRETEDGRLYIVMASYDGETLQQRIARGPLPLAEAVAIAAQVASGLAEAHAADIIHRDIKPANIVLVSTDAGASSASGVEGGGPLRVKILDFGLARAADDITLTRVGASPGTPHYMAPEQIQGEIDRRSDLWSLGVVLFEMLTGKKPFHGETATTVIYSVLQRDPIPLDALRPGLPPELSRLLERLLTKDPEQRIANADDTLAALTAVVALPASPVSLGTGTWTAATQELPIPSSGVPPSAMRRRWPRGVTVLLLTALLTVVGAVWLGQRDTIAPPMSTGLVKRGLPAIAVLPFDDLSSESRQTFFADGLTEILITDLAKVSGLRVISRASAMVYQGVPKPVPEVARELGVDYLLQGSVLRAGDQVRISTQLVDGEVDQVLWSESYERSLEGVLALQSDVARAVVEQIEVRLTPRESRALSEAATVAPRALELFVRARALWNERTVASIRRSIELLEEAIEIDPAYALLHVALAESYQLLGEIPFQAMPRREADRLAQLHARRALELDPSQGEAYATLAMVDAYRWDWRGAEEKFHRAIDLSPGYATAHQWFGEILLFQKRWDEARRAFWRAELLDPLSPIIHGQVGRLLLFSRHNREAADHFEQQTRDYPSFWLNYYGLAASRVELGDPQGALEASGQALELSGGSDFAKVIAATIRAQAGQPADATLMLQRWSEGAPETIPASLVAGLAMSIGDKERALSELERGVALGDPSVPFAHIEP